MQIGVTLTVYFPDGSGGLMLMPAGGGEKALEVESLEAAQDEARSWVRRNRMSNPKHPGMRYKVEVFAEGKLVWQHDET